MHDNKKAAEAKYRKSMWLISGLKQNTEKACGSFQDPSDPH